MTTPQNIFPHVIVDRGAAALEFYGRAFAAREIYRLTNADGTIAHAEIEIAGNVVQLAEEYPSLGMLAPNKLAGTASSIGFYVEDVDRAVERAVAAGAELERPIVDEFYGDRVGMVRDPFGHRWSIHTCREKLTSDEIVKRFAALSRT